MSPDTLQPDVGKRGAEQLIEQARRQNDRAAMISQLAKDVIRQNRYRTGELPRK